MTLATQPILEVRGLSKEFPVRGARGKVLTAVSQLDLSVHPGETLAIVGESGSGKSTAARCITRLIEPTAGTVSLCDQLFSQRSRRGLRDAYSDIQMVFQDPRASLNPRMTVQAILDEPLRLHTDLPRAARVDASKGLLNDVGLPMEMLGRRPGQLSGGQRQRVSIARALAVDPKVIIFDEPTASLDVSVRGQILELLVRLQRERSLAYLFISHDLEVVRHVADRVLVMYLGTVVETGPTAAVFAAPQHPYTRALLSSILTLDTAQAPSRLRLTGEIPSPIDLPRGCRLTSRCPLARPECAAAQPPLELVGPEHMSACPVVAHSPQPTAATPDAGAVPHDPPLSPDPQP